MQNVIFALSPRLHAELDVSTTSVTGQAEELYRAQMSSHLFFIWFSFPPPACRLRSHARLWKF